MAPAGVLTVADLLNRNAPVPTQVSEDSVTSPTVTVGSLLRREGRLRQEQSRHEGNEPVAPAPPAKRINFRRGAVAAGTLLAASSVIGAAVVTNTAGTTNNLAQDANGEYPGQGRLDPGGAPSNVLPGAAIGPAAESTNTLDPGTAPPKQWVPVAFPSAAAGVPDVQNNTGDGSAPSASTPGATGSDNGSGSNTPTGGADNGSGGGAQAAAAPGADNDDDQPSGNADRGIVGGLVDTVGNVSKGVGGAVGSLLSADDDSSSKSAPEQRSSASTKSSTPQKSAPTTPGPLSPVTNLLFGAKAPASASADGPTSAPQTSVAEGDQGGQRNDQQQGDDGGGSSSSGGSGAKESGGGGLIGGLGRTVGGLLG